MANLSFLSTRKLIGLLNEADPTFSMSIKILSSSKLAIGIDPLNPTKIVDLSKEIIEPIRLVATSDSIVSDLKTFTSKSPVSSSRKSGNYALEISNNRKEYGSQKQLLRDGLLRLESYSPGMLEKLSHKGNKRRIVSRDRNTLFLKPHLVKNSERLTNEWWIGTNNSSQATRKWLRLASDLAGLSWERDVKISL